MPMFKNIFAFHRRDLQAYSFEYLQWLGYDQNGIVELYHRTFKRYMAMDYAEQIEEDLLEKPNVLPNVGILAYWENINSR